MKRLAIAASIVSGLLMAVPVPAQQKLGDVAGSIKLKKSGEQSVVIDGSDVGQTSKRSGSSSGTDLLYEVLTDGLDVSRTLSSMVADAPRIKPVRYSDGWHSQLDDIGARLESVGLELEMLPDAGPYEAAYLKAVGGLDQVQQGYDAIVEATNGSRLVASTEKTMVSDGANTIEEAMTEVRAVGRSQAATAPPTAIDPIAAANSIRNLCLRQGAEGSPAYGDCVEDQDAAKNEMVGRTAPSVGLDTAAFNKIRNGCLYEWPNNYVNRNACETRRAAAASGG
jgi:hypothetical protein